MQHRDQLSFSNSSSAQGIPVTISAISQTANQLTQSLLSTATVYIYDDQHHADSVRVILDPASQSNFITKCLVNKLGLKTSHTNYAVVAVEIHLCLLIMLQILKSS